MATATLWDPFGFWGAFLGSPDDTPAHVKDAGNRMVTDGNNSAKPRKKKLYFGGESMVPDDWVPPPPVHPVVFDGKINDRELHVRNFYRHFACFSPSALNDTIVDRLESLGEYRKPAWYNGVLASCTPTLVEHEVEYDREEIDDGDGGVVCIDWAFPAQYDDVTPTVLIFPGLAGHSGKDYIRSVVKKVVTGLGWRAVVLNWRGFNSPLASAKVFRPDDISDMEAVINAVGSRYPVSQMYGVGFSAGSNQLVKYLGKTGKFSRLCAGVSVCNGFEYQSHLNRIEASPVGKGFYSRGMTFLHQVIIRTPMSVNSMSKRTLSGTRFSTYRLHTASSSQSWMAQEYIRKHGKELQAKVPGFDVEKALAATSHSDLDEVLVKSLYGFEDVNEYYAAVASRPFIPAVEVPLLCLQAADDPLFTENGDEPRKCWETLPVAELHDNENIVYFESEYGSHLNFVESNRQEGVIRCDFSFADRAVETFFETVKAQMPKRIMF